MKKIITSAYQGADGRYLQPIIKDDDGRERFKPNTIVRFLLENGKYKTENNLLN